MNALNRQVQQELRAAAREATVNSDVKAVIVYGGEKVFAAGADVKEMSEMTFGQMADVIGDLQSDLAAVSEIPKPPLPPSRGTRSAAAWRLRCRPIGASWATTRSSACRRSCSASFPEAVAPSVSPG